MLTPVIQKNDKQANWLIAIFSVIVFVAVTFLSKFTLKVELPFDKHIFALINALLNTAGAIILVVALIAVKQIRSFLSLTISLRSEQKALTYRAALEGKASKKLYWK